MTPSTRPLRIAMVGLRGIPATHGGVERAVEELSAALVERGHHVTVFARRAYSDPALTTHRGVEVEHLAQINTKHLEAISHTALAVSTVLRQRRYDIVHFHATGPSLLSFIPRLTGVSTVSTVHGLDWRREKWGTFATAVLRIASHAAVRFPTETIVVSQSLQRHYASSLGAETEYVPNGVSVDAGSGVPPAGLMTDEFVLFLGRLVPEKHAHTLIKAYAKVQTALPLVIAGPETHSPAYARSLRDLAAADPRVALVGPRYGDEKTWLLKNAAAFVQPSSIEGLPISLLEAAAAARYPIVSDIPENIEPITSRSGQVLGRTFEVGDTDALAQAITSVLGDPDRAAVGAILAEEVRASYDWQHVAEQTEHVYRRAVASR